MRPRWSQQFTRSYHLLHSTITSLAYGFPQNWNRKRGSNSGNIWLDINYWPSCGLGSFSYFCFWQLGFWQRAEYLQDRRGIHSERILAPATCCVTRKKRAWWLEGPKGGSYCDKWLWAFIDFISIHYGRAETGAGLHSHRVWDWDSWGGGW